jgi:hypothetical protein
MPTRIGYLSWKVVCLLASKAWVGVCFGGSSECAKAMSRTQGRAGGLARHQYVMQGQLVIAVEY